MKYYTAFIYDQAGPLSDVHCTHKYLGGMTRTGGAPAAVKVVDEFITRFKPTLPSLTFEHREFFGPHKNIPVLLGAGQVGPVWGMLRDLLSNLGQADDYLYNPHVTTDALRIVAPFTAYALMSKDTVIKEWKL